MACRTGSRSIGEGTRHLAGSPPYVGILKHECDMAPPLLVLSYGSFSCVSLLMPLGSLAGTPLVNLLSGSGYHLGFVSSSVDRLRNELSSIWSLVYLYVSQILMPCL